jgi:hypothetical protein
VDNCTALDIAVVVVVAVEVGNHILVVGVVVEVDNMRVVVHRIRVAVVGNSQVAGTLVYHDVQPNK